jgi:vitamin B12 transporter
MFNIQSHQTPAAARALSLVSLITISAGAAAQVPLVVTASRMEQLQTEALPHTTVITAQDIRNSQAGDLPALLRREAGISMTQNGGPGQTSSLFVRGGQPNETLILIDGVPVRRQGFAAQPALENISPEQIERIEIVRGNVSSIYGSSAIGGVIQIFTRQGQGKPAFNASVMAGSRGTTQLSAGVTGKSDDVRYASSLSGLRTDGISSNSTVNYPNENADKDGYTNRSFGGSVSKEWAKGNEIGARLYYNDAKYDFDGGGFGARNDIHDGKASQHTLAVFSKNRFLPQWVSNLTLSQTGTRSRNIAHTTFGFDSTDNSDTTLLQWANEFSLAPAWTLVGGIDSARERADTASLTARNSFSRSTNSVYAGINGKIDAHQLQFNVRHDRVGGSGSELTGYLGYGYSLTPTVKLIANASTAFNAPTLLQLYDTQNGNPALKAETSKSYELGAQYAEGPTLLRATLFQTRTANQFSIDPANCFSGAYPAGCPTFNVARATNYGLELSGSGKVSETDLHASLTLQNPRNDITGATLIRRPRGLASFSASRAFGALRLGGDMQFTGHRPDGVRTLEAYWLANLNARYALSKEVSLFGRIDNVFNRDYQTAYGYNQEPRGIFVGISWQQ